MKFLVDMPLSRPTLRMQRRIPLRDQRALELEHNSWSIVIELLAQHFDKSLL